MTSLNDQIHALAAQLEHTTATLHLPTVSLQQAFNATGNEKRYVFTDGASATPSLAPQAAIRFLASKLSDTLAAAMYDLAKAQAA
jgi:hypothetical protein